MRVTFGQKYNQMEYNQNKLQNKLTRLNDQISTGSKIKQGYQDPLIQDQDLKLRYKIDTLGQNIDSARKSESKTLDTDKALSEISKTLDVFKVRLLNAINDTNSDSTRHIIANELKNLKSHIIDIANTSVSGDYIFSGTKTNVRPFDQFGNYSGDNRKTQSLISDDRLSPDNITGEELFFGYNNEKTRKVTSNIPKLNQSALLPSLMSKYEKNAEPKQVYVTENDTLRDLIGDSDDDSKNDGIEYFYLRGVDTNGRAFKTKFHLDKSYSTQESAIRVADLLNNIGQAFGNTDAKAYVSVTLNDRGEIQIEDLKRGNSTLQFQMISSDKDVDNIQDLYANGAHITYYNQSPYRPVPTLKSDMSTKVFASPYKTNAQGSLITRANLIAEPQDALKDIFPQNVSSIKLTRIEQNQAEPKGEAGKPDQIPLETTITVQNHNVSDLLSALQKLYGKDFRAELDNGSISLIDLKAKDDNSTTKAQFKIETLDSKNAPTQGIAHNFKGSFDESFFSRYGNKLLGNIRQVILDSKNIAQNSTRLSQVAQTSMNGEKFNLSLTDHSGKHIQAKIEFDGGMGYLVLPPKESIPKEMPLAEGSQTEHSPPYRILFSQNTDDTTYRQLLDALSIALTYSNQSDKNLKAASAASEQNSDAYKNILGVASGLIETNINKDGRIEIYDKQNSKTPIALSFSNERSDDFTKSSDSIILNANNALTISDPKVDFFHQLDSIIKSVDKGFSAPDSSGYDDSMRLIGMQNGVTTLDNLSAQISKMTALNGSYGKRFVNSIDHNETLQAQAQSLRSENMGIDMAKTYNDFAQIKNNYEASLTTANRINDLALYKYL